MRQWRVGTLSMGLLLVFTGVGLLLSQFDKPAVIEFSLKWWPVIFILLGIEVLLQNQFKTEENSKLKYDIFSIIIILGIIIAGLGLHIFSQLGLVDRARMEITSQVFAVQDSIEIPLEEGIQKIVLTAGHNQVDIHSSPGNSVIANSTVRIRTQSQSEAQDSPGKYQKLTQQRVADTLYIELPTNHGSLAVMDSSYALIIPEHVNVEIDGADNSLNINLASIQDDWQINGSGNCTITLPAGADLMVNALVNENVLHGNLAWNQTQLRLDTSSAASEHGDNQVQATAKLGNGTHKLNILGVNELTVNCLP